MPPFYLLGLICFIMAGALTVELVRRNRLRRALRHLAAQRHLHFTIFDKLRLTPRVAGSLPVPGAAAVRIVNLLYGSDGGRYRYVFTVEYTTGVVQSKHRERRVAMFSEPRDRPDVETRPLIRMAPSDLPLVQQYESLLADSSLIGITAPG